MMLPERDFPTNRTCQTEKYRLPVLIYRSKYFIEASNLNPRLGVFSWILRDDDSSDYYTFNSKTTPEHKVFRCRTQKQILHLIDEYYEHVIAQEGIDHDIEARYLRDNAAYIVQHTIDQDKDEYFTCKNRKDVNNDDIQT
jgi:hypothetical protein